MCDPGLILGIASGVASVAAQGAAMDQNRKMINQQSKLEYAAAERERLVKDNEANKQSYQAQLQADRNSSALKAAGEGMGGVTAGQRIAEQQRQGALSIANAKDAKDAANANYTASTQGTQIEAVNGINKNTMNPFTAFMNVATSGLQNYGTIKTG